MEECSLVSVYCQVYNTPKSFLCKCVESVLGQTYKNIEFYILNNGCTDSSGEILEEYARADSRINLITDDMNKNTFREIELLSSFRGTYYSHIDADDWWEPDYLERLVTFAENNRLDMVCTGRIFHVVATGTQSEQRLSQQIILSKKQFPEWLPFYHVFMRTIWGKLIRMDVFREVDFQPYLDKNLPYGRDTLISFAILRGAGSMGVDSSALYHYRVHLESKSYQYNSRRFDSDICLYNDAIDFLSAYGSISIENKKFLQAVYSNAIVDTMGVIHDSSLSPRGKLQEYRAIALHPLTQAAYRECDCNDAVRSRKILFQLALMAGAALGSESDGDLRVIAQTLSPGCGLAVSARNAPMFLEDNALHQGLFQDDPETILAVLLERMEKNQEIKKYAVPETIRALSMGNPLLCQIEDAAFLRRYTKIYRMVWRGENIPALEEMTGLLLENKVSSGKEAFLQLYISLAALTNQAPAFVFGKLQLAWLLRRQKRWKECCLAVEELTDMGVENEELTALRQELEKRS